MAKSKIKLPKRGFKRVGEAVTGKGTKYKVSNAEKLEPFFTKKGEIKKSAVRSKKKQEELEKELAKAKAEIAEQRKENARLREQLKQERKQQREQQREQREKARKLQEQLKKEREERREEQRKLKEKLKKDTQKRKQQKKTYKQNGGAFGGNTYEQFVDILNEVYDEIALLFYDSDQIMEMLEDGNVTPEQIKELLVEMNKRKFDSLSDKEKELVQSGKYKMNNLENDTMIDDMSEALYLSTKSDLSPLEWYEMKQNNLMQYEQEKEYILNGGD